MRAAMDILMKSASELKYGMCKKIWTRDGQAVTCRDSINHHILPISQLFDTSVEPLELRFLNFLVIFLQVTVYQHSGHQKDLAKL
jgi:hypothetical protein